ncbi:MAG: hypothetical protein J7M40_07495, partial [Planctomycetes bacterium]|nr:hypothetical protein [Planctomycetota bacterium]
ICTPEISGDDVAEGSDRWHICWKRVISGRIKMGLFGKNGLVCVFTIDNDSRGSETVPETMALPSAVRGPVECSAFFLFASSCFSLSAIGYWQS